MMATCISLFPQQSCEEKIVALFRSSSNSAENWPQVGLSVLWYCARGSFVEFFLTGKKNSYLGRFSSISPIWTSDGVS